MNAVRNRAVLTILFILLLCSCSEQEPIKAGFIGSLSGKSSELCLNARDGAQMVAREVNGEGGLGGRQVEFVVFDVSNSTEKTQASMILRL
jgi:branched-chain amino acid transport system substrate-binding protein